jgi:hypothetical protein
MAMSYQSVFQPGLFAGQVVVVTGGGSGIDRCVAHELAAQSAKSLPCMPCFQVLLRPDA